MTTFPCRPEGSLRVPGPPPGARTNYPGRRDAAQTRRTARWTTQEVPISAPTPASWAYAETFVDEDDVVARARARGDELGCRGVRPGVGTMLRLLAATGSARSIVEIGTGAGVSGVHLLRGMPADGVLTTIDLEAENQRAARETFAEAGFRPNRTRLITGRALDVLPRLTDRAYDLVLLDAETTEYDAYVDQALRLLRRGGVLAVTDALWRGKVADPAQRDRATTTMREVVKRVRDDERLTPALLPVGDGLLLAVLR